MSAKPSPNEIEGTVSLQIIDEERELVYPAGLTIEELLKKAKIDKGEYAVVLSGVQTITRGRMILEPGAMVELIARDKADRLRQTWRKTIGMFRDDPTFHDMIKAGRAIREADRAAARSEDERAGS
jgi:hypothetical protein